MPKTVLLVDDEQTFLEALEDALDYDGYRVLKARDVSSALEILGREAIDVVTVDIMLSPGSTLQGKVDPQRAGIYLCEYLAKNHPSVPAFCLSVVSDHATISQIQTLGIRFLRKGETPLRTVLNMIRSRLTGLAYSTEWNDN
ncbi:MAG TPA: response regulator [Candidatus Angelobacter sp.]|nr:response regulator [Candidatus Angelobacter sp.]